MLHLSISKTNMVIVKQNRLIKCSCRYTIHKSLHKDIQTQISQFPCLHHWLTSVHLFSCPIRLLCWNWREFHSQSITEFLSLKWHIHMLSSNVFENIYMKNFWYFLLCRVLTDTYLCHMPGNRQKNILHRYSRKCHYGYFLQK